MSRRSVASTPLSPDDLPDLPDIDEPSQDSSESMRAAAVTSSYSEICLSVDEELNEDLLPGELQDLNQVQDTTEEITRLVDQLNQGDDAKELTGNVGDKRRVPTTLEVDEIKVLPTLDAQHTTSNQRLHEDSGEVVEAEEVTEVSSDTLRRPKQNEVKNGGREQTASNQGSAISGDTQDTYVAEDIHDLIRQASRSTSLAPTPAPDVSRLPSIIAELEQDARRLATSVQRMMETLSSQLHNVTHLTDQCMLAYESGIRRTCDAADANVKSMYRLLAKYEELSNAMQPVHAVAAEVRAARQLVGQLETLVDIKRHKTS